MVDIDSSLPLPLTLWSLDRVELSFVSRELVEPNALFGCVGCCAESLILIIDLNLAKVRGFSRQRVKIASRHSFSFSYRYRYLET